MGRDGFLPCWDTCRLGDGYTLQGTTVSLNAGTAPFMPASLFFFQKISFGSLHSFLFDWFGVLLVRGSPSSGDRFQRPLFTATALAPVSRFPYSLFSFFLSPAPWLCFEWLGSKRFRLYPLFFISVGSCGEVECSIAFRTLIPSLYGSRRG
jgi:hypothetical protein